MHSDKDNSWRRSLLAGMVIGLGVLACALATNPVVGAFLFSVGLLFIINQKLPLYTGKCGYIGTSESLGSELMPILLMNWIGCLLVFSIGALGCPGMMAAAATIGTVKASKTIATLFFGALLCGGLIHMAVKAKHPLITVLCVMVFILIGAEHCIAIFPYLFYHSIMPTYLIKLVAVQLGNTLGAIAVERLTK